MVFLEGRGKGEKKKHLRMRVKKYLVEKDHFARELYSKVNVYNCKQKMNCKEESTRFTEI